MVGKSKKMHKLVVENQITKECFEYDRSSAMILNEDCLLQIFEYLPISDRIRLERVSKRWRSVSLASWRSFKTLNFTRETWGYFDQLFVTTEMLKKVLARCSKFLTDLDMSDYDTLVHSVSMDIIIKKCPNLNSINLSSFKVNAKQLKTLISKFTKLEKLTIGDCSRTVDDDLIDSTIATLDNLKVLKFKNHKLTGWCLQSVNSAIEELHFEYCQELDMNFIRLHIVDNLHKLHTLSLRGSFFHCCADCSDLQVLNLTNIKVLDLSYNSTYVNDKSLTDIAASCSNLQSLDLSHNHKVTDVGLAAIITLNLEHLRINSLWYVTGSSLTNLPSLMSLSCCDCLNLKKKFVEETLKISGTLNYLKLANCPKVPRDDLFKAAKRILSDTRQNDIILKIDYTCEDKPIYKTYTTRLQVVRD